MKLPSDAVIAVAKLTRYLLVPQRRNDKSAYLALAGYSLADSERLLADLHAIVVAGEAVALETNAFGQYFKVRATLTGPNGRKLRVVTIWMTEHLSRGTKFITLLPDAEP